MHASQIESYVVIRILRVASSLNLGMNLLAMRDWIAPADCPHQQQYPPRPLRFSPHLTGLKLVVS